MDNNHGFIIHKANHKKGCMYEYDICKENRPVTPKQVVNVFDLGYIVGIEKDFSKQYQGPIPYSERNQDELSTEEIEYDKSHSKRG